MESIWARECPVPPRETLRGDRRVEIAVIGAGLAGVLIASALQEAGRQVIVLEAGRIAGGQTQNTTAKITSQHGLIYRKLISTFGKDKARQYAMANEAAIREYEKLITRRGIDCDFERRSAFLYGSDEKQLRAETGAAVSLGLTADYVTALPLPFPVAGAVRFANQAQFDPMKFILGLSKGLTIFENTPVYFVKDKLLITEQGNVRADKIVFACHFPFVNFPGWYFARMHQERSYVLALENAAQLDGMYIGADKGGYSFRNAGSLLLLGGENHRCGENSAGGRYDALRQKAREWYPGSREVACWSAQDCMTLDGVPYIGRFAENRPNWYAATGFQKWGMTSSMVAAMLLRDSICGRDNPWAPVFSPQRFGAVALPPLASEMAHAAKGLLRCAFGTPKAQAKTLPPEHGGVVQLDGKKAGVYRDEQGTLHSVGIRCPHLGCQLEWNPDERSWDCPCHGSRFDCQGQLISGPAQEDLP